MCNNQMTFYMFNSTWLKVLLLVFAISFTILGFSGNFPEQHSEFSYHFISVLVEICLGGFITYTILDEVLKREKKERLSSVLLFSGQQIITCSRSIVVISLGKFLPIIVGEDLKNMYSILEQINKASVIPESDTLEAMWDGFKLWEKLFFKENSNEPKEDYPQIVLDIFQIINRYIKHIRRINLRLEETALELEAIEVIFGFELTSEYLEESVTDFQNGKQANLNLMSALHGFLITSIHMYSFCLAYNSSIPQLERIEIYKHGFRFNIQKMKWWL